MRKQFIALAVGMLLATIPADGQNQDALLRWGDATLNKLEPFLPNPSAFGFFPEFPGRPSDFIQLCWSIRTGISATLNSTGTSTKLRKKRPHSKSR
jgi:hypothetical protein